MSNSDLKPLSHFDQNASLMAGLKNSLEEDRRGGPWYARRGSDPILMVIGPKSLDSSSTSAAAISSCKCFMICCSRQVCTSGTTGSWRERSQKNFRVSILKTYIFQIFLDFQTWNLPNVISHKIWVAINTKFTHGALATLNKCKYAFLRIASFLPVMSRNAWLVCEHCRPPGGWNVEAPHWYP